MNLTQGPLGWAKEHEDKAELEAAGVDVALLMAAFALTFPKFNLSANVRDIVQILNQHNQGACQGHALAMIFSICFFLATGRWLNFSRAAAYYLSQKYNNIRGDNGSTLNGGNWVATQNGLCLEEDWPYPSSYDPRQPESAVGKFLYKLVRSKPFKTVDEMKAWMELGLPIQTGIDWNNSCNREVIYNWQPGGGGHSTCLWLLKPHGPNNINSWGEDWCQDGVQSWTWETVERMLRDSSTVFIGYAPDGMIYPDQTPVV